MALPVFVYLATLASSLTGLVVHVGGDDPLAVLVPRDPAAGLRGRAPQRNRLVPHHRRVLGVLRDPGRPGGRCGRRRRQHRTCKDRTKVLYCVKGSVNVTF